MIRALTIIFSLIACACTAEPQVESERVGARIVSLDFCADQYVLKFAARENIIALSPDAQKSFSYMREQANGIPTIRPRAEDILLLNPDMVVRTYGGGPGTLEFFERAGINVVQIGYASRLEEIPRVIIEAGKDLGAEDKARNLAAQVERHTKITAEPTDRPALYVSSKGAVAGKGTMIDDVMVAAGVTNYEYRTGWRTIPLEELAFQHPEVIATGFFETTDLVTDRWTPTRHPIAKRQLAKAQRIDIPGAWTACASWSVLDAINALTQETAK